MRRLLWIVVFLTGCGQQSTGPDPLSPPRPSLNAGTAMVQWVVASPECPGCATFIFLDQERRLRKVVIEPGGFWISAAETKDVEWRTARDLVMPLVDERQEVGCDAGLPEETFVTFAGDAGWSTRVEGCEAPEIERAREHLRDLVRRYLPEGKVEPR